MRFYLGTPCPTWVADERFEGVSLCISRNRLVGTVTEGMRARTRWILDSGAFSMLSMHGRWIVSPRQYAKEAKRWQKDIGQLDWASSQDWMTEPEILEKTGKSVVEHQRLTVRSYLELMDVDPSLPWIPILQGWTQADYLRHVDMFGKAGVDLTREPVVGLGSCCRREATQEIEELVLALYRLGVTTVHTFGMKTLGLQNCGKYLESSDSMAWSYAARFRPVRLPGCKHADCQYCEKWALQWRRNVLRTLGGSL